jgi:uncharacterized delta-60 repeat protein
MNTKITNKISTFVLVFLAAIIFGATNIKAAPGDLDLSFGSGGKVITGGSLNIARAMAIQSDGKIVVVGEGATGIAVVRYNTDGSLDTSFGGTGIVITPVGKASSVAIQADGKIVVAGSSGNNFAVVRYNTDGSLDTSFNGTGKVLTPIIASVGNSGGYARALAIQADGKIVVVGDAGYDFSLNFSFAVVRYNSNGSLDTSFNGTGQIRAVGDASSVAIQMDGKIVVAVNSPNGSSRDFAIFRYNTDGSPDISFNGTGKIVTQIGSASGARSVAIQTDGKIVAAGGSSNGTRNDFAIVRYNTDGSLDTTFNGTGKVTTPVGTNHSGASSVAIQPDGKIVAAGSSDNGRFNFNGTDFAIVRLNPNGSLDTSFNGTGKVVTPVGNSSHASSVAIQSDGKIVVAGTTTDDPESESIDYDFALVRYQGGSSSNIRRTRFDFDGDGRADISVFRPSNRTWYFQQSANGFTGFQFGDPTDKLVPADFDGDGKTDIAVYRDGTWYLQRSKDGFLAISFGDPTDIPMPADFDGDGKSELVVFRLSNGSGTWFVLNMATSVFNAFPFGTAGDIPVVADYDGDAKADYAVYRPSEGVWYMQQSTKGFYAVQFGNSTDKPVPADYDGDGKSDVAVYRPSEGTWYQLRSTEGFYAVQFGNSTDLPTPADYDGDGKTDVAVFRPSEDTWYQLRSTLGFNTVQFGANGDRPIPNAFVP